MKIVNNWLRNRSQKPDTDWDIISTCREEGRTNRLPYERQWQMNLAFLAGRQRVLYNTALERLQQLAAQKGRKVYIDNKILPRYMKQISRLIKTHPRMSVVPASTDAEDLKAAKKADRILKWFWRQARMRKKIRKLAGWIYGTGNGFLEDTWNPKIGPIEIDRETGNAVYLGDVSVDIWTPFELLFPSVGSATCELDDLPWLGKERYYTLEWIVSTFGEAGKRVTAEPRPETLSDVNLLFGTSTTRSTTKSDGALVTEIRYKPSTEYPKGLRIIGAAGVILRKEDYPDDTYHMEHFKDIEIPGCFYGMATTEAAICLQRLHNDTLGDIAEFNKHMAKGKWLIPRNSNVEVAMNDEHGQEIRYTPVMGHKPELMDLKGLPSSYITALELVAQGLMELYHQHEVTQGTNKSDIRSGDMVGMLLEQDDSGNIPTHAIFEESLEALLSRVLERMQKGYTTERVIAISGKDDSYDVEKFMGADLRNNTDVNVVKDSTIPESKTARQFRVRENYKEGLYGNPADPRTQERVLRMLDEVPDDIKDIFAESHKDRQIARMENVFIMTAPGTKLVVNDYDDHQIHLEEHHLERKEAEYQKLKFENPTKFVEVETGFIQHEVQHQQFLEEAMQAQEAAIIRQQKLIKGE
jgi:hypothetical protein